MSTEIWGVKFEKQTKHERRDVYPYKFGGNLKGGIKQRTRETFPKKAHCSRFSGGKSTVWQSIIRMEIGEGRNEKSVNVTLGQKILGEVETIRIDVSARKT